MTQASTHDEALRLAAVRRYDILDTPPDGAFDRITRVAARLFDVPISIVSIVDEDRIWFKSHHGLEVEQIPRGPGLCASAILDSKPWVLTDASTDPRSLTNPLVAGEFGLRFYAGVPLRTHDGHNLGTLCVIDRAPRPITATDIEQLTDLAAVVMDELELRLAAKREIEKRKRSSRRSTTALRTTSRSYPVCLVFKAGRPLTRSGRTSTRVCGGSIRWAYFTSASTKSAKSSRSTSRTTFGSFWKRFWFHSGSRTASPQWWTGLKF